MRPTLNEKGLMLLETPGQLFGHCLVHTTYTLLVMHLVETVRWFTMEVNTNVHPESFDSCYALDGCL